MIFNKDIHERRAAYVRCLRAGILPDLALEAMKESYLDNGFTDEDFLKAVAHLQAEYNVHKSPNNISL